MACPKFAGRLGAALQKALPDQRAQHSTASASPTKAALEAEQLQSSAGSAAESKVGQQDGSGSSSLSLGKDLAASSSQAAQLASRLHDKGDAAMTEGTAHQLIEALNAHQRSILESSQTLTEASRQLKDACLLLKGPRHRV